MGIYNQESDEDFAEQHAVCGPPAPVVYKSKPPSKQNMKFDQNLASADRMAKASLMDNDKRAQIEAALRTSKSNSASIKPNLINMMNAPKSPTESGTRMGKGFHSQFAETHDVENLNDQSHNSSFGNQILMMQLHQDKQVENNYDHYLQRHQMMK